MTKNKQQPTPKSGKEFKAWAVFNCGTYIGQIFDTRKEGIDWCIQNRSAIDEDNPSWKIVGKYHKVVKVKCIFL